MDVVVSWALKNKETSKAMTKKQREVLRKPFFPWDAETLKEEVGSRYVLTTRLKDESRLVAETESVLYDLATHLPDLSPKI